MDHSCYKCGHSVDDGKPFCAECGAPQIRVAMPEVLAPVGAGNVSSSETVLSLDSTHGSGSLSIPAFSTKIEWPWALRACAIAALIAALVMALGLIVPLLAGLGAGFLAVMFYHRRNPAWSVNVRSGARLGAVCGLLFFAISAIIEAMVVVLFHAGEQVRQKVLDALQQAAARATDPQVQSALESLKTPEGWAAMLILGLVFWCLLSVASGSLAGALTGAFLGRRNRS
jgi:hypothetical protein